MIRYLSVAFIIYILFSPHFTWAQSAIAPCVQNTNTVSGIPAGNSCVPVSASAPMPVGVYGGSSATAGYVLTSNGPGILATFQPNGGGGTGSVTNFSFTNLNGATGSVTNSTTTPNLTLAPTAGGTFASSLNNLGFFASTTSAQLAGVISDETGTGVLVFNASPTFTGTVSGAAANWTGALTSLSDTTSGLTVNGTSTLNGATVVTSSSATAFVVGPNGTTNPTLTIVSSAASAATGISITANAAGSTVVIGSTSSAGAENISIVPKGGGTLNLGTGGGSNLIGASGGGNTTIVANSTVTFQPGGSTHGQFTTSGLTVTGSSTATTSMQAAGFISTGTKFTATGCSNSTTVGGATAGKFTSGAAGSCTVVITMNGATGLTAPNGWDCSATDLTTAADLINQTTSTATTATLSGTTVLNDVISFHCVGY